MRANNTPQTSTLKVVGMQRIENVALWQSYAAKLNSMKERAKKEGGQATAKCHEYERKYYFHGTGTHAVY